MSPSESEARTSVAAWPVLEIVLNADGTGSVNGRSVVAADMQAAQDELLSEATRYAGVLGRALRVRALDPNGVWHLVAHPDGSVTPLPPEDLIEPGPNPDPGEYDETDRYLAAPPPVDPVEDDDPDADEDWPGTLHLRVHPSGAITPVDSDSDSGFVGRPPRTPAEPATTGPARSEPSPFATSPFAEPPTAKPPAPPAAPTAPTAPTERPAAADLPVPEPPVTIDPAAAGVPEPERATPEPERTAPESERFPEPEPEPDDEGAGTGRASTERPVPGRSPGSGTTGSGTTVEQGGPEGWTQHRSPRRPNLPPAARSTQAADEGPDRPVQASRTEPVDVDEPHPWATTTPLPAVEAAPVRVSPDPAPGDRTGRDRSVGDRSVGDRGDRSEGHSADLIEDLRADNPTAPRAEQGRGWIRPAAAVGAGAVLVGLVLLAVELRGGTSNRNVQAATARPAVTRTAQVTPGAGGSGAATAPASGRPAASPPARLAVAPPPGFGTKPVWGVSVPSGATPLVSTDGRIFALTADRQISMIDPAGGSVLWHAPVPDNAAGPHLSTVDGRPTVAVVTPDALSYWPLPATSTASPGQAEPTRISLPAGSTVSWAGPSPLVVQADGNVSVVREGSIQRVTLPTGMRALAADGADVLAASGRDWVRQAAGQAPMSPKPLAAPAGAIGTTPVRVDNIGGSFLAGMWEGPEGPIAAVYDAHSGEMAVQTTFPKGTNFAHAVTVREAGTDRTAVGTALLDPGKQNLSILNPSFTPLTLAPGHVYARESRGVAVDLQIKGSDIKIIPFQGKNPAVPVGVTTVSSRPYAIVVVPSGSGWQMCALPTS